MSAVAGTVSGAGWTTQQREREAICVSPVPAGKKNNPPPPQGLPAQFPASRRRVRRGFEVGTECDRGQSPTSAAKAEKIEPCPACREGPTSPDGGMLWRGDSRGLWHGSRRISKLEGEGAKPLWCINMVDIPSPNIHSLPRGRWLVWLLDQTRRSLQEATTMSELGKEGKDGGSDLARPGSRPRPGSFRA